MFILVEYYNISENEYVVNAVYNNENFNCSKVYRFENYTEPVFESMYYVVPVHNLEYINSTFILPGCIISERNHYNTVLMAISFCCALLFFNKNLKSECVNKSNKKLDYL